MKKVILIIVCMILISGCSLEGYGNQIEFKDVDDNHGEAMYKFTGKSEHFAFETGKAYYDNLKQGILITNFKVIKNISKQNEIEKYRLDLSFKGKSLFGPEMDYLEKDNLDESNLERRLKLIRIEEYGDIKIDDYGESDAFFETTQFEFKDAIKLKIVYCYKNGNCIEEDFNFSYITDN